MLFAAWRQFAVKIRVYTECFAPSFFVFVIIVVIPGRISNTGSVEYTCSTA